MKPYFSILTIVVFTCCFLVTPSYANTGNSRLAKLDKLFMRNQAAEAFLNSCDPRKRYIKGSFFIPNSLLVETAFAREMVRVGKITREDAFRTMYRRGFNYQAKIENFYAYSGCRKKQARASLSHIKNFGFSSPAVIYTYIQKF